MDTIRGTDETKPETSDKDQQDKDKGVQKHEFKEFQSAIKEGDEFLFGKDKGREDIISERNIKNTYDKDGIVYEGFSFDPVSNTYKELNMEIRVKTDDNQEKVKEAIEKGATECPMHKTFRSSGITIHRKIKFI